MESGAQSFSWVGSATSLRGVVEELASIEVVLGCGVRNLILEETLLGLLEGGVLAHVAGNGLHRVLVASLLATSLVQLVVAELSGLGVVVVAVESVV